MADVTAATVRTPTLEVAYEERGPGDGPCALLLHGWPDDVRTWDAVADRLADGGYRVVAPYLRGFGRTDFRDSAAMRSGQYTALAQDAVDLLDALGVERAVVVGHDWGALAGYAAAALWPGRVERLVAVSAAYDANKDAGAVPPAQARQYWYQWYFHLDGGRKGLTADRRALCRVLWDTWSPGYRFDDAAFDRTAESWDNPSWVETTLHFYRYRWGAAQADNRYADLEAKMAEQPRITVPTTVLHGADDGATSAEGTAGQEGLFAGGYRREVLDGVGHFVPRERPDAVADAVLRGRP